MNTTTYREASRIAACLGSCGEGGGPQALTKSSWARLLQGLQDRFDWCLPLSAGSVVHNLYIAGYGDAREAVSALVTGYVGTVHGIELLDVPLHLYSVDLSRAHLTQGDFLDVTSLPPTVTHVYSTALVNFTFYCHLLHLALTHPAVTLVTMFSCMWRTLGLSRTRMETGLGSDNVVPTTRVALVGGKSSFTLLTVHLTSDVRRELLQYLT